MKRRNAECGKLRRPLKRSKIGEGVCGSVFTYIKFFFVWAMVLLADFILDFRFEYLWPLWLVVRSVYDLFKYQGLAFSIFFVCVTITSDIACYLFIPVQWLFFTASTYVWVQYVWQTERGICLPTVLLWFLFLYIEVAVRLRDLKSFPFHLDLCRPFAAHCVGYPVITMGFSFKSCIAYRFRMRKQKEVEKENQFYFQLLDQALPSEVVQNNNKFKALPSGSADDAVPNGNVSADSLPSLSNQKLPVRVDVNGWSSREGRTPDPVVAAEDFDFFERALNGPTADDDDSDESSTASPSGVETSRSNGSVRSSSRSASSSKEPSTTTTFSKKSKSTNLGANAGKDAAQMTSRLEADIKRLKADLQSSRATEQELRSQINSLSISERATKLELSQLRQDNDSLQAKLHKLVTGKQQDKQALGTLERRLQDERKQKTALEQQLTTEKQRRKNDDSAAAAAVAAARNAVAVSRMNSECTAEQCKVRRWELENDLKQLHRELQLRDEQLRQLERETQALQQRRGESQSETELLMNALGAIQDKNAHLETSLSAETRHKLDLFSALGDAKRQIEIQTGLLIQKDRELSDLKSKIAEVMPFLPPSPLAGYAPSSNLPAMRYSPSSYAASPVMSALVPADVAVGPDTVIAGVVKSTLNPAANDYMPKITQ